MRYLSASDGRISKVGRCFTIAIPTSSPAFMGGAYPGVRSRARNLRKPSAAVRRDGGGGGESEGARERVGPSSLTLWRRVSPRALRFAGDSPLERGVSCELVSENAKFPASREFTGNFIDSSLGGASEAAKNGMKSVSYEPIPYES